jgi:hypothetical protein
VRSASGWFRYIVCRRRAARPEARLAAPADATHGRLLLERISDPLTDRSSPDELEDAVPLGDGVERIDVVEARGMG